MKKLFTLLILLILGFSSLNAANYSLEFDGTNDYVDMGDNLDNLTDLSFESWIYVDGTGSNRVILRKEGSFAFMLVGSNHVHVNLGNGSNWGSYSITTTDVVPTGEWVHVAATRQSGTGTVKVYINGMLVDTQTDDTGSTGDNANPLRIGAHGGGAELFDGKIDEVRVWSDVRTAEEITAEMNNELVGNEANLLAYYKLNETSGTTANDSSTNSYTGTLINFPATPPRPSSTPTTLSLDSGTITTTKDDDYIHQITTTTDGWGIEYSISGGADQAKFTINSGSGVLTFTDSNDAKINGTYTVEITATFGGLSDTKTYSVVVDNTNRALEFDGTDDYIDLGKSLDSVFYDGGAKAFSVETWAYVDSSTLTCDSSDYKTQYQAMVIEDFTFALDYHYCDGNIGIHVNLGDGSSWDTGITESTSIEPDTWNHIAVTKESNNELKLYLNGKMIGSYTFSKDAVSHTTNNLLIGSNNHSEQVFKGKIDEVRIWNDVRTASEIQTNMNKELAGNEAGLVSYYNFNESSGTTLNDRSPNSYTGTLTNFADTTASRIDISPSLNATTLTTTKEDDYIHQITTTTDSWGIAYSISGGTDGAKFSINSTSGVLTFVDPNDAKINGTYSVEITATFGGLSDTKTYSVVVANPTQISNTYTYEQLNKLTASDKQASDTFGHGVSIDGDYAVVGAFREDTGGNDGGAAYIFKKNSSGDYTQIQKIQASDI
ncbi:MAG: hypothetical protein OIF32_09690, partial [Campylobacterales bacterium]|nr:hypothetical protein [Campylobacterales bacterium]